ncbi:MAG: alpha/beta hydrolase [Nocardioides sp.]|nr:alpha/beta hydrolase [Nocardioides sp.]
MHTTDVGDTGERVVLLHGLFGQGRNFTQVAKALSPELRSTLVDLPNHGRSAWTDDAGYEAVAETVADWMAATYDAPVHLVGHSMGGKVAMVLAVTRPELVDRLVVVDIAPGPSDGASEFEHLLGSLAAIDLDGLGSRGDADEQLAERVHDERVRGFLLQNLRRGSDGWHWQANLDLLRDQLDRIGGFPHLDASFDGPTLWVAGERSDYIGPEHEAEMHRLFPRVLSVTVKGAGHWVHSEQPEAFVSVLRTYLLADDRDLRRRGA